MIAWLLLVLASTGPGRPFTETFDLVEINHKIDANGCEQFVQIIGWDWSPDYCRLHCEGWVIVKHWKSVPGGLLYSINDGQVWSELGGLRVCETWTTEDPEVENRSVFPAKYRRWRKN